MRPRGGAGATVLEIAQELYPGVFKARRRAGIPDSEEPAPPIRKVGARLVDGRWVLCKLGEGTLSVNVDRLGREVYAVPDRIDPFDPLVADIGWVLGAPPYRFSGLLSDR